jgi:hypothetical protein
MVNNRPNTWSTIIKNMVKSQIIKTHSLTASKNIVSDFGALVLVGSVRVVFLFGFATTAVTVSISIAGDTNLINATHITHILPRATTREMIVRTATTATEVDRDGFVRFPDFV